MNFVHIELKRDTWLKPSVVVKTPEDAVKVIKNLIKDIDKEVLCTINLATNGAVINAAVCSIGSICQSVVSIAEIVRLAILSGAAAIILVHNHPSGSTKPSKDDVEVTRRVAVACQLMDLNLLDHIIIGDKDYVSIKEEDEDCFFVGKNDYKDLLIAEDGGKNIEK